jgi:hypothetical protein
MATEKILYINVPFPESTHEMIREKAFKSRKSKGQTVLDLVHAKLGIKPKAEPKSLAK